MLWRMLVFSSVGGEVRHERGEAGWAGYVGVWEVLYKTDMWWNDAVTSPAESVPKDRCSE